MKKEKVIDAIKTVLVYIIGGIVVFIDGYFNKPSGKTEYLWLEVLSLLLLTALIHCTVYFVKKRKNRKK